LETVIGHKSDYLEFIPAFAPRSELRLVINESFPVIVFNENYSGVHGTLVKGLNGEDINRILFFEDVEFTPQQIDLEEFYGEALGSRSIRVRHDVRQRHLFDFGETGHLRGVVRQDGLT
jgi:hypothetical protein